MKDEKLIELLQEKKVEFETELETIMKKRIPIWRTVNQEIMIDRIKLVLEGLKTD